MPRGDGTGPPGKAGPGTGRGGGRGRMGGTKPGSGPGGKCKCPSCGITVPHQVVGVPCYIMKCPNCGTRMFKE